MNPAQAEVRTAAEILNGEEPAVFRELHETLAYRLLTEPELAGAISKHIDQIEQAVVCDKAEANGVPVYGEAWYLLHGIVLYLKAHGSLPDLKGVAQFVSSDERASTLRGLYDQLNRVSPN